MSSLTRRGSNHKKRVVLSAEALEDRDVPAGNVTAFVSGGVLQITGDGADNRIWVMGLEDGKAIIAPLDNTTINGVQAPQILGGIAFAYSAQMGAGNDFLYYSNISGGTSLFAVMGDGNDGLAIDYARNSGPNIFSMGSGNDVITVGMGQLKGFTTFDLGSGKNRINVAATEFGGVAFRGSGSDSLGMLAVNFRSAPIMSGMNAVYSTMTPTANHDRATVRHGTSGTIDVASNDTAPGNTVDRTSIKITQQPEHGTVSVNPDGTIKFTADSSTATFDSFKYTIRNSSGAESNEATVVLVLTPVHTTPDTTGPIPTITNTGGNSTNLASIPFTITFNEDVTDFAQSDIVVTNGTISGFNAVNARTFTFNVAPTADGAVTVSVAAGAAKDAAGNNSAAASRTVTSDRTPPTATITSTASNPTGLSTIPIEVKFNEDVTGFVVGDLAVTGGSVSGFTPVDARTYRFDVTRTGTGPVEITVNVAAGVATDLAGNSNTAATEFTIVSNTAAPSVAITSTSTSPTNASPIRYTAQFSKTVEGFVEGDITVTGGTLSNFVAVDGDTYTFDVTPTADGTVTVSIAAGVATDTAGNPNTAATPLTLTSDRTPPTAVVTGPSSPTSTSPIQYTVEFSENVINFTAGDILVTNGAVSSFTAVDGNTYTFTVVPSGTGVDVSVSVPAGATQDAATNANAVSNIVTVTFSGSVVTTTIAADPTVTDPTNLAAIPITVTFSEDVTGFTEADLSLVNGTVQASSFTQVDARTYTFTLVPTADGPVTVDVPAGAGTGPSSTPTSAVSFTIASDRSGPTATVSAGTSPTDDSPIIFTVTFNEDVTGLVAGALNATNGTIGAIASVNARTFTVEVTPTADGVVTLTVLNGQVTDLVGNDSTADFSGTITSDRTDPTVAVNTTSSTAGVITGTSSDTSGATGVAGVKVSISNGTNFWNGTEFTSATEQFFDATSTDNFATWSLAFTTPGTYTVHAIATDTAGNEGQNTNNAVVVT